MHPRPLVRCTRNALYTHTQGFYFTARPVGASGMHARTRRSQSQFAGNIHPHLIEDMPPDYELQSYWKNRFEKEYHFEWLGDGSDTILPYIQSHLLGSDTAMRSSVAPPARLLHIGAGTSSLSERIRELYRQVYGPEVDERKIVNTDFAENLVARQREKEAALAMGAAGKGMQWACVDALKWDEMKNVLHSGGEDSVFDIVVDKSTSDAISCGEDVLCSSPNPGLHPALNEYLAEHDGQKIGIAPVELLALHLASLVRPGGLWIALTFSSDRFLFLSSSEDSKPHAGRYWTIQKVLTVDAPTGMEGQGYAPIVQHYVFLLHRRDG